MKTTNKTPYQSSNFATNISSTNMIFWTYLMSLVLKKYFSWFEKHKIVHLKASIYRVDSLKLNKGTN